MGTPAGQHASDAGERLVDPGGQRLAEGNQLPQARTPAAAASCHAQEGRRRREERTAARAAGLADAERDGSEQDRDRAAPKGTWPGRRSVKDVTRAATACFFAFWRRPRLLDLTSTWA